MKVSVIVPCYNQAHYLDEALQSVLEQSYNDWECIIVNDGSTDHTESQTRRWTEKDKRFKYYSKSNGGLPSARNFGIERAEGTFILPLDADDKISTNYIEQCIMTMKELQTKLVYGKIEQFGTRTGPWDLGDFSYQKLLVSNIIHCSAMFRKTDWGLIGGYDETLTTGLEDWEFWVHLLEPTERVVMLDDISFYYRIKTTSMIQSMSKEEELKVKAYVFKKHSSKYFDLFSELSKENNMLKQTFSNKSFLFKRLIKLILIKNR